MCQVCQSATEKYTASSCQKNGSNSDNISGVFLNAYELCLFNWDSNKKRGFSLPPSISTPAFAW